MLVVCCTAVAVGMLISVMKKEKMYLPWVAVGWKLGAGRLDKCRTAVACCTATAVQHATSTHTPQDRHLATPRTPYAVYVKIL